MQFLTDRVPVECQIVHVVVPTSFQAGSFAVTLCIACTHTELHAWYRACIVGCRTHCRRTRFFAFLCLLLSELPLQKYSEGRTIGRVHESQTIARFFGFTCLEPLWTMLFESL
jgi:hypothetical protein